MKNIFYPKQLIKSNIVLCENQCFFAMPFSEEYTNLYDTLVLYIKNAGYKCIRVDNNLSASVPIINLILNGIATSQYVIVDISEANANVFYELGITHTVKDFENVFIIKEENSKTPFDIQHLQYIAYNKNNLKVLANELVKRLNANQYKNYFKKELFVKQLLNNDEIDEFVVYFSKIFDENLISTYTAILGNCPMVAGTKDQIIVKSIWEYDRMLQREINNPVSEKYIPTLFKIFFEILLACYQLDEIQKYVDDFLKLDTFNTLSKNDLLSHQTDLAIKFAQNSKLIHISLKWIIEYFQRSKSTKVDLNRYKLEGFLLKSDLDKVNEYLINALLSENNYIREHIADIVGEKGLCMAEDNLIAQLKREQNVYTFSSIVEALGKIHSKKSLSAIQEWLKSNDSTVIKNQNYFVLKHVRNAIVKIDSSEALKKFDNKYFQLLVKTNII